MKSRIGWAAAGTLACLAAHAQTPQALYTRSLAATCAACHGTDGHAAAGSDLPGLAGMPPQYMLRQLQAFRDGSRPATVMQQIARGYSELQLQQIAAWFGAQPR